MLRAASDSADRSPRRRPPSGRSSRAAAYGRAQLPRFVRELSQFLTIPSISSQPARASQVRACAEWLHRHLQKIGLTQAKVVSTARHPVVYAGSECRPGLPTVLIYGHYDVQPVEPLNAWHIPPFAPAVRDGQLYARGSSDDKGQLFCHVKAIESCLRGDGRLPVNVKCLFEGEEEIGSPNLHGFLRRNRRRLAADVVVISDTSIPALDRPAIIYGLRGGLALELQVVGPRRDLHSGHFGGAIHNPLQVLCEIIARFHDADGRIAIPGAYDGVVELSESERNQFRLAGVGDEDLLSRAGVSRGWGEPGFTAFERTTVRPALTINGLMGGYSGPGTKSIVPSRASAKVSFRLAPQQDPDQLERSFRRFIARITPPTASIEVRRLSAAKAVTIDRQHPAFGAARRAYQAGFGHPPVFLRSGGTIPIVDTMQTLLGVPVVLMGFGLPDDSVHGPNERFDLRSFSRGVRTSIEFLHELGDARRASDRMA